jgi:uncharacterized membrane protein
MKVAGYECQGASLAAAYAVQAVIRSSFILMRQNRMMRRAERRDHLNLQVDLLAEKEITKLLQMVQSICEQLGRQNIMADKEIRELSLSQSTSIESLSHNWKIGCPGHRAKWVRRRVSCTGIHVSDN